MNDPREFQNFDDIPGNTGWNTYPLEPIEEEQEDIDEENDCDESRED